MSVVVVSIPNRDLGGFRASIVAPERLLPLVHGGVNSNFLSTGLQGVDQFQNKVTVRRRRIGVPGAAGRGVDFDVDPDHAIALVDAVDQFVGLLDGALSSAGEHVDIDVFDSSIVGVLNI